MSNTKKCTGGCGNTTERNSGLCFNCEIMESQANRHFAKNTKK